jgi:hypothetical protein
VVPSSRPPCRSRPHCVDRGCGYFCCCNTCRAWIV